MVPVARPCVVGTARATRSLDCWRACGRVAVGSWSCVAKRASASRRCSSTGGKRRPSVRACGGGRAGRSRVVVLRGEAGVGKSALLEYVVEAASECQVVRAAGVEYEMELPYAGLHLLCAPALDLRERLPAPQRDALA